MPGKSTGQERVHSQVRADILGGRLHPGQRLRFAQLCEDYGASVGVVREAMSRLAEQGLVTSEAQFGVKVVSISRGDLIQLTQARVCVETFALRLAIADGDLAWESQILASHHALERTPMLAEGATPHLDDAWSAAHAVFHAHLLSGSANLRLCSIAANLRDSAEIYRRWSVSEVKGPARDIAGEHRAILEATLERDADRAAALLQQHFELTTKLLLESDLVAEDIDGAMPTGT